MKQSIVQSAKSLQKIFPLLLGMLLLISLMSTLLTAEFYQKVFGHGNILDALIGALAGSVSAGAPINSYILGGEFLKNGVSLTAITAFIVTWVSVGLVQVPLEVKTLGVRFTFWRNLSAFILALFVAVITSFLASQ